MNALYEPANRTNQGRVSAHSVRTRLDQADVLARATGLDMVEAGWRPTVDNYLGRVAKPRILDAVREAKGASSAQLIDHLKKTDMAKEAERLLDGSGWLPEPLRLVDLAASPAEPEGEAGRLPEFLTEGEEGQESASDDERPQLDAAERDCIAGRPRPSCSPWGPGRERRSPCSWQRFKRESRAGKGLNCRGLKESAGRFGPVPLSRDILP